MNVAAGVAIAFVFGTTIGILPASACEPSTSYTDPSCANIGLPNAFNTPPMPTPYAPYYGGPVYALGVLGLLEGAHPTMIYPAQPVICRQGIDCPGDTGEASQQPEVSADQAARRHPRGHRRRQPLATPR